MRSPEARKAALWFQVLLLRNGAIFDQPEPGLYGIEPHGIFYRGLGISYQPILPPQEEEK